MGGNLLLFEYPTVLNTPTVLMISPHLYHDIPTVLKFQRMVSPTVLNTPMVLIISLHVHHDIPHCTEHPHGTHDILHGTHDIPHGTQDIPHGTEHPHGTQDMPHGIHDIPHSTEHPHGTEHPYGTAHTLYRVIMSYIQLKKNTVV